MSRPPKPEADKTWFVAKVQMPDRPEDMPGLAHDEWDRISPYLTELDRVAVIDRQALTAYCLEWAYIAQIYIEELHSDDNLCIDDFVQLKANPTIYAFVNRAKAIFTLCLKFGLTARSRYLDSSIHGNSLNWAIKKLEGNKKKIAQGKVRDSIIPMLPAFEPSDMQAPLWFKGSAKAEYDRLRDSLLNLDLFTPIDYVPLCVAAMLGDLYIRCAGQIDSMTVPVYDKKGNERGVAAHPMHQAQRWVHEAQLKYWQDYGLTPRDRKVLTGQDQKERKKIPLVFEGAKKA